MGLMEVHPDLKEADEIDDIVLILERLFDVDSFIADYDFIKGHIDIRKSSPNVALWISGTFLDQFVKGVYANYF